MEQLKEKFDAEVEKFNQIERDLQVIIQTRQKLEAQHHENLLVMDQFKKLDADAKIYKQIGPVLIQQSKQEAQTNVDTRLKYIKTEVERNEKQLKELSEQQERKRQEIVAFQAIIQDKFAQMQQQQQQQAQAV